MERLQKIIANSGVASRRKAEELIQKGRVAVDGKIVREMGVKVGSGAVIEVDGVKIGSEEKVYFLLNKPRGIITSTKDDKHRKTVVELIESDKRIYPVGRLDYDTTGALLLTNDGEFANLLMHPKNEIDKVYIAKVKGIAKAEHLIPLKEGIDLDGTAVKASRVKLRKADYKTKTSMIELTIHEGKNHQVKKMCEAVGLEVLKLKRERIAFLDLKGIQSGEYRPLSHKEVHEVYALAMKQSKIKKTLPREK